MIKLVIHARYSARESLVPECWDELTPAQLVQVAGILFTEQDAICRDLRIACALCGLSPKRLQEISGEDVALQVMPLVGWVTEGCDLTAQLLPVLDAGRWVFHGPLDHLRNLRFGEFDAAERALHEWHKCPEDFALLCKFIAAIYRPEKPGYDFALNPDGDGREAYNDNLTEAYAAQLMIRIKPAQAYAVLLWYNGCRQFITASFPRVFSAPDVDKSEVDEPAYFGLIRAIAKEGIYGTFEQVEGMYLYNALTEMEAAADERAALEAAIEEAKGGAS